MEWVDPEDGHSFFMEAWAYLPKPVMEWAGLSEPDPKIGGSQGRTLSQWNDGDDGVQGGLSLQAMASLIRENL